MVDTEPAEQRRPYRGAAPGESKSIGGRSYRAVVSSRWLLPVGLIGLGVAFVVTGTVILSDLSPGFRVGGTIVGLVLVYLGAARVGRRLLGPDFDLGVWASTFWLILISLGAILADVLPLSESRDVSKTLQTPILLRPDIFSAYPLGTDTQGLDILGGVLYGARVSLVVGVGAVLIGSIIGGLIGLAAGYFRGPLEGLVNLLTDSMLAFPALILLLAMAAILEPNVQNVTLALGVLAIPTYVRVSRANTLVFAQRDFVLAAQALGVKNRRILWRELLPNVAVPVLSYGFVVLGALIVAEASLSFLGLSIQRPDPTWGNMIAAGSDDLRSDPHLVAIPGMALFLTVFSLNRVGDRLRQSWENTETKL